MQEEISTDAHSLPQADTKVINDPHNEEQGASSYPAAKLGRYPNGIDAN
jgi:hypothetical protein